MKLLLVAALTTVLASAQSETPSGAKALFFTPESGKETPISSPTPRHSPGGAVAKPSITGLKYYIELRQPDGSTQKVSVKRVFHSGDRIRLCVAPNMDGDLVIYQKQEDEPEEQLYPASNIPDATGYVKYGSYVTLPSVHGWFRFDDHPGQIRLTLLFTARAGQEEAGANRNGQVSSADFAHKIAGATKGSKALRVEDDQTDDKAQYKVVDSRLDGKIPVGVIATEVTLAHAR